jgi:hypothetical protein
MKKTKSWGKSLLIVFGMVLLAACSKKPPECADAGASETLRKVMNASIAEGLRFKGINIADDSTGLMQKYLATWTFDLSNVTTQGYDEKSKTRSCAGKVTISIPDTKQTGYVEFQYDMQVLEDAKSGDFQLRASKNFETWAYGAIVPVANHYRIYSVSGTWSGMSTCRPSELVQTPFAKLPHAEAAQGFTILSTEAPWQPDEVAQQNAVKMTIADGVVNVQIAGPDGKSYTRTGKLESTGSFKTSAEDEMKTAVVSGARITSDGGIRESVPGDLSVAARVKSNATGNEMDALQVRRCDLKKQ